MKSLSVSFYFYLSLLGDVIIPQVVPQVCEDDNILAELNKFSSSMNLHLTPSLCSRQALTLSPLRVEYQCLAQSEDCGYNFKT
jgi:hypothetical protein